MTNTAINGTIVYQVYDKRNESPNNGITMRSEDPPPSALPTDRRTILKLAVSWEVVLPGQYIVKLALDTGDVLPELNHLLWRRTLLHTDNRDYRQLRTPRRSFLRHIQQLMNVELVP